MLYLTGTGINSESKPGMIAALIAVMIEKMRSEASTHDGSAYAI